MMTNNFRTLDASSRKVVVASVHKASRLEKGELPLPESALPVNRIPDPPATEEGRRRLSRRMAVCVKPFHYEWNRALWLVEFVEFYKKLGTCSSMYCT